MRGDARQRAGRAVVGRGASPSLMKFSALIFALTLVAHAEGDRPSLSPSCPAPGPDVPEVRSQTAIRVTFFPPTAPVFGTPISDALSGRSSNRTALKAPDSLAEFVSEYFYPALGSRMAESTLSGRRRNRIDAYATTRTALSTELQDRLASRCAAVSAACERELRAFALRQTPRIGALEKEAAQLREDLVQGGLRYDSVDWNEARQWHLADRTRRTTAAEKNLERLAVRAAVYYQSGRLALAALPPPPLPALAPQLPLTPSLASRPTRPGRPRWRKRPLRSCRVSLPFPFRSGGSATATIRRCASGSNNAPASCSAKSPLSEGSMPPLSGAQGGAEIHRGFACCHRANPDRSHDLAAPALLQRIDDSDRAFAKLGREGAIYPGYRSAMVEPGLSPEQRRLLFGAALVGLAQPLPFAEQMPGKFPPVVR